MNKKWRNMLIFIGTFFIIIFGLIIISEEDNNFSEKDVNNKMIEDEFPNVQKLHWSHMPLTYKIINNDNCGDIIIEKIKEGMEIIRNSTEGIVSFVEVEQDEDIEINCIDRQKRIDEFLFALEQKKICKNVSFNYMKNNLSVYEEGILNKSEEYFLGTNILKKTPYETIYSVCYAPLEDVEELERLQGFDFMELGEGGPTDIQDNLILNAVANFYKRDEGWVTCAFPSVEIHEILHSFGFGHSYEPYFDPYYGYADWTYAKDIMFPHNYCQYQKELNSKYVSCLKYIYSNGEIGRCSSVINFIGEGPNCENGLYPVEGTEYCCPEPDMIINEEGYCSY